MLWKKKKQSFTIIISDLIFGCFRFLFDNLFWKFCIILWSAYVLSARLEKLDVTLHYHSTEGILDITYKGVNKWTALHGGFKRIKWFALETIWMTSRCFNRLLLCIDWQVWTFAGFARRNIAFDDQIEQNMIATLQELCFRFAEVKYPKILIRSM